LPLFNRDRLHQHEDKNASYAAEAVYVRYMILPVIPHHDLLREGLKLDSEYTLWTRAVDIRNRKLQVMVFTRALTSLKAIIAVSVSKSRMMGRNMHSKSDAIDALDG
jgi:hypothetical protein